MDRDRFDCLIDAQAFADYLTAETSDEAIALIASGDIADEEAEVYRCRIVAARLQYQNWLSVRLTGSAFLPYPFDSQPLNDVDCRVLAREAEELVGMLGSGEGAEA